MGKMPTIILDENLIPQGWEIVENVEPSRFEVSDLEFVSCLEKDEEPVLGEIMRQRAIKLKANLGLADMKYVLEHMAEIPAEFRGKFLLFPGTLFDCLHIPCLIWRARKWRPCFVPVGFNFAFGEDDLLVRYKFAGRAQA